MIPEQLLPLSEYFKRSSAYWGQSQDWLVCYTTQRDADALYRSNFRCFLKLLGGTGTEGAKGSQDVAPGVRIEEATHWACGWVRYLIIDPANKELIRKAEQALEQLDNYPVIDESNFSQEEQGGAAQVWRDCYRPKERVNYIREHRSQFEFHGMADLIGCVRGKYFAGCASELLN